MGGTPALLMPAEAPESIEKIRRPRPIGSGGSQVDSTGRNLSLAGVGDSVCRWSTGGMEARRGRLWDFSLSLESESDSSFVFIAVFDIFVSA